MLDRLRWLHIADLHVVGTGDEFSQEVAIRALIEDVSQRVAGSSVDFVLVSGDVAFSGKVQEYERASSYLGELAAAASVSPREFYFVPGNHDVDRERHRLALLGAHTQLAAQQDVDRLLGSADDLQPLIARQEAFWSFVTTFTVDQERQPTADGLAYAAPMAIDGVRVVLLGLNSSWLCGTDEEETTLLIGERQVINALDLAHAFKPHLLIVMAHHPIAWLREWDQTTCAQRLLPEAHFFHRGHLHVPDVSLTSSPGRPCLLVAAGSGHATRFYGNSYNLIELDLGEGTCVVRSFRYDPTAGTYGEAAAIPADILIQGRIPGTIADLTAALALVASAAPYSTYMSDLLRGAREEIPIKVGDQIVFRTLSFAEAAHAEGLDQVRPFMRLRNLFRLYDDHVSLSDVVRDHASAIAGFAAYLTEIAEQDSSCADRLQDGRTGRAPAAAIAPTASPLQHTIGFLEDVRANGDWPLLEVQARRFTFSADNELARRAKAALAEALMHSDEAAKRAEGAVLAGDLARHPEAGPESYLLAAGCAEVVADERSAVSLALDALARWPMDSQVREYARQLALRTGNKELRARLETTGDREAPR